MAARYAVADHDRGEMISGLIVREFEALAARNKRSCRGSKVSPPGKGRFGMKDESRTLAGWPAVRMFLMLAVTPVLTALVMSLPVAWLVNHVFATGAIHAVFGVERFGYWQAVGLFALWYAARTKIKVQGPSK